MHHLACGRIQRSHRFPIAECDINAVAFGHQTARQFGRPAAERTQLVFPKPDFLFPEQHATEGVPGDQHPLRGLFDGRDRSFINDVEETSSRRDGSTQAGQVIVAACPLWAGHPLQVMRRRHPSVLGHGVVVGSVKEVSPFVNVVRPWFHDLHPFPAPDLDLLSGIDLLCSVL